MKLTINISKQIRTAVAIGLLFPLTLAAQLNRGGTPLGATEALSPIEMGPVPTARTTRAAEGAERPHQVLEFAHKFKLFLSPDRDGTWSTAPDGTRVWHLALKSAGARSINLLFENYRLPRGARLYLYNAERSDIKGAFTEDNNTVSGILPTAPVEGDRLVVEYQEPPGAEFSGSFEITELNHDTVGVLRAFPPPLWEPKTPECQPNPVCYPEWQNEMQSVAIIITDGKFACTGTLINTTANDGTPYFITAAHLFRGVTTMAEYERLAKRSLFFFNYQSPSCNVDFRGPEEMSIASAEAVMASRELDVMLLKLSSPPPPHFRPYYAGWNRSRHAPPYTGIHQPNIGIKKWSRTQSRLSLYSPASGEIGWEVEPNCFALVDRWSEGITEGGSSGSPLFDSQHRMVGGLTGGYSRCSNPVEDFYFRLDSAWTHFPERERQLKPWLDPLNNGATVCDGLDPYAATGTRAVRLSNVGSRLPVKIEKLNRPESGMTFGKNSLQTTEYAERFKSTGPSTIHGVHLITPQWRSSYNTNGALTLYIYEGGEIPTKRIASFPVSLSYLSTIGQQSPLSTSVATDNYFPLPRPVTVDGTFFVAYSVQNNSSDADGFAVYNADAPGLNNSAYVKSANQWLPATRYSPYLRATSLWLDPVVSYGDPVGLTSISKSTAFTIAYHASAKQLEVHNRNHNRDTNTPSLIRVFSTTGIEVARAIDQSERTVLSLQSLNAGIYIVFCSNDNDSWAEKIRVE